MSNHSPLRVKSRSVHSSPERSVKSPAVVSDKSGERHRSPIQIYKCPGIETKVEEKKTVTGPLVDHDTSKTSLDTKSKKQKSSVDRKSVRNRPHDPFKSTTEVEDDEFHFDFDQDADGASSFVNTT